MHWQGAEEWEFPYGSTVLSAAQSLLANVAGVLWFLATNRIFMLLLTAWWMACVQVSVRYIEGGVSIDGTITNQTEYDLAIAQARVADVVIHCTGVRAEIKGRTY